MCGIVGAIAERNIVPILMEGLRRLEYRGYDSAGIAVLNGTQHLKRLRTVGKVKMLQEALEQTPTHGNIGIAHTRWATHGVPSERNAHPHISRDGLAIVHNGIIENHDELRADLERLRLHLHLGDGHRGDRASHPLSPGNRRRSLQSRARHGRGARRRLCARRRERTRSGSHHPRARGLPGGHWPGRSTRTSWPRMSRRSCR